MEKEVRPIAAFAAVPCYTIPYADWKASGFADAPCPHCHHPESSVCEIMGEWSAWVETDMSKGPVLHPYPAQLSTGTCEHCGARVLVAQTSRDVAADFASISPECEQEVYRNMLAYHKALAEQAERSANARELFVAVCAAEVAVAKARKA